MLESENTISQIAVVGTRDSVLPFRTLGMQTEIVESADTANSVIHKLVSQGFKLFFISEDIISLIGETVDKYKNDPVISLISIPCSGKKINYGLNQIKNNIERAVGSDLFLSTEE